MRMIMIELEVEGLKMDVALFGDYVDILSNFIALCDVQRPIIVVQYAKVKKFKGSRVCALAHNFCLWRRNRTISIYFDLWRQNLRCSFPTIINMWDVTNGWEEFLSSCNLEDRGIVNLSFHGHSRFSFDEDVQYKELSLEINERMQGMDHIDLEDDEHAEQSRSREGVAYLRLTPYSVRENRQACYLKFQFNLTIYS